jgi:hypothetical protein
VPDPYELDEAALIEAQGWNDATLVGLYREYISRQGDDDAFLDFLRRQATEENEAAGCDGPAICAGCRYCEGDEA